MPLPWNDGILEYWNNVLKTYNFSAPIKVLGINFHYLSMNIFIGSGDNHSFMAIMAFPNERLSSIDIFSTHDGFIS